MIKFVDNDIEKFREYIDNSNCSEFSIDISSMNLFNSLKFMVLSSAYFYQKFPHKKLKCHAPSDDIKNLISSFKVKNLEFI